MIKLYENLEEQQKQQGQLNVAIALNHIPEFGVRSMRFPQATPTEFGDGNTTMNELR